MKINLKKKSTVTLVLLLAALVVLTTVTYAWFTASNTVKAIDMLIETETDATLEISSDNTTFGDSASFVTPDDYDGIVKPATSYNGKDFYMPGENCTASGKEDGKLALIAADGTVTPVDLTSENWSTIMSPVTDNSGDYMLHATYYIRSQGGDFSKIRAVVDVKQKDGEGNFVTATEGVMSALRVSVTIGDSTVVYAPVTGADKTAATYNGTTVKALDTLADNDSFITAAVSTDSVPVYVNAWYEGQDANCTSYNAIEANSQLNISVSFAGAN